MYADEGAKDGRSRVSQGMSWLSRDGVSEIEAATRSDLDKETGHG